METVATRVTVGRPCQRAYGAPIPLHEQRVAEARVVYLLRLAASFPSVTADFQIVEAWFNQVVEFRNLATVGTAPFRLPSQRLHALTTDRSGLSRYLASRGYQSSNTILAVEDVFIARSEIDCPIHGTIARHRASRHTQRTIRPTDVRTKAITHRDLEDTGRHTTTTAGPTKAVVRFSDSTYEDGAIPKVDADPSTDKLLSSHTINTPVNRFPAGTISPVASFILIFLFAILGISTRHLLSCFRLRPQH
ncbi:hypothetical protein K456DRAFT_1720966 [Colletotrichum gloeosporioides 23]|nr:hypothetical protein K456DRAFT_1720966 [Colletotrichum gloeosporioides 23]